MTVASHASPLTVGLRFVILTRRLMVSWVSVTPLGAPRRAASVALAYVSPAAGGRSSTPSATVTAPAPCAVKGLHVPPLKS